MHLVDHPGNNVDDLVLVTAAQLARRPRLTGTTRLVRGNDAAHRLMRRATRHRRTPIAAHLPVGGHYVHPFPRVLQYRSPARSIRCLVGTDTVTAQGHSSRTRHARSRDFYLAKTGTQFWPPVGTFHGHGQRRALDLVGDLGVQPPLTSIAMDRRLASQFACRHRAFIWRASRGIRSSASSRDTVGKAGEHCGFVSRASAARTARVGCRRCR
jgi:hypothetical protein